MAARIIHCRLPEIKSARGPSTTTPLSRLRPRIDSENGKNLSGNNTSKILLQSRLSTLRSYGSDGSGVIKTATDGGISEQVSPFVDKLFDYIDTTTKSHDFEIVSGRLSMMVFAATVTTEVLMGSSIFQKLDTQGIDDAAGACLGAISFAAVFAWVSIGRQRVGVLFDLTRNAFIDSVVDQIVDGLLELSDWSDEA